MRIKLNHFSGGAPGSGILGLGFGPDFGPDIFGAGARKTTQSALDAANKSAAAQEQAAAEANAIAREQMEWQKELANKQLNQQAAKDAQSQSYLNTLFGKNKTPQQQAAEDNEASDIIARNIAMQQANRASGLAQTDSLNAARQSGSGNALASLLASQNASDAARQTYQNAYGGAYSSNLGQINQGNANLLNAAGMQSSNANQAGAMGNSMANAAGQSGMSGQQAIMNANNQAAAMRQNAYNMAANYSNAGGQQTAGMIGNILSYLASS